MHIICFNLSSLTCEFLGYKYVGVSSYFSFILLFYFCQEVFGLEACSRLFLTLNAEYCLLVINANY